MQNILRCILKFKKNMKKAKTVRQLRSSKQYLSTIKASKYSKSATSSDATPERTLLFHIQIFRELLTDTSITRTNIYIKL